MKISDELSPGVIAYRAKQREKEEIRKKLQREYQKQWREENREEQKIIQRRNNIKRKYGITLEDYKIMLELQGGCCAICGANDPKVKHGVWCIDHDHKTGKIRGLLCQICNWKLSVKEDIEWNVLADAYLERYGG